MKLWARWIRPSAILFSVPLVFLAVGCAGNAGGSNVQANSDSGSGTVEPLFPPDYETTFEEIVSCHETVPHGNSYTRIFANSTAADEYLAGADPLPEGSMIVKAEYSQPDCPSGALTGWSALEKRVAGFNSDAGDWHWQLVSTVAGVLFDDEATCIGCHSAPDCADRDFTCASR